MEEKNTLSVCLITYNHVKFIKQAIEGVLMQKVNFPWELIIADDFSTDGTREIILEFQKQHPNFIKLILQEKNVGAAQNWIDLITSPQSKYIAYFEGDDYWTDPFKLQKQVDFLEAHPEITVCGHNISVLDKSGQLHKSKTKEKFITFKDEVTKTHLSTLSLVFINKFKTYPKWFHKMPQGDWPLKLMLLNIGKGFLFQESMAVYRLHENSIWTSQKPIVVHRKVLKGYRILLQAFKNHKKDIEIATVKYKIKYKLFFKDFSFYLFHDILVLFKLGIKKIIK